MTISIEALKEAIKIKEQIAELEARLQKILGGEEAPKVKRGRKKASEAVLEESTEAEAKPAKKRKRKLSPEARERIAAAQKARWAARKA